MYCFYLHACKFYSFVLSICENHTVLEAGVRLLRFVLVAVFVAMVNGAVMEVYGFYMPCFFAGGILITIGGALLYTIKIGSSVGRIYGYSVIATIETRFFVQTPFSVVQAKVDAQSVLIATAFVNCSQISGITLSLAIAISVFVSEASRKIEMIIPDALKWLIQATIAGAETAFFQDQSATDQHQILEAIVFIVDHIYIMVLVDGVCCVTTRPKCKCILARSIVGYEAILQQSLGCESVCLHEGGETVDSSKRFRCRGPRRFVRIKRYTIDM